MLNVCLEESVVKKIARDKAMFPGKIALLEYYSRMYTTEEDGSIVEHGDGIGLQFINEEFLGKSFTKEAFVYKFKIDNEIICFICIPDYWKYEKNNIRIYIDNGRIKMEITH